MMVDDKPSLGIEWMDDFLADWRLEVAAPEEFWSLMAELSPFQARLVREVFAHAVRGAFTAGSGEPIGR
jgi:hypothetical protein